MEHLNLTIAIDTPENVMFNYSVAGIGSRFLASLIDTTILTCVIGFVYISFYILVSIIPDIITPQITVSILTGVITIISFLIFWGFFIFFELTWNGQTPGKKWVGIRVVRLDGSPVTLIESIIRNLIRIIDFLPAYYGVGLVTMFVNSQSRRLGDLAAGTVVIYDQGAATIEAVAKEMETGIPIFVLYDSPLTIMELDTIRLKTKTIEMAEIFLRRRHLVGNQNELAIQILHQLEEELGGPITSNQSVYSAVDQITAVINFIRKNS